MFFAVAFDFLNLSFPLRILTLRVWVLKLLIKWLDTMIGLHLLFTRVFVYDLYRLA